MIPPQLQHNEFRFIKVRDNKAPIEDDWTGKNNYTYIESEITDFIKTNQRYGILCGVGGLIVVDFDSQIIQDEVLEKLPKTFTVKSAGKGLLHLYYKTDNPESFKILDLNKNTLADIQGKGKQVIGANSLMPNGRRYEIVNDVPITGIMFADLKIAFSKWLNIEKDIKQRETKETDYECKLIKEKIKVPDLLREYGVDVTKNPTACPLHASKGGKCLSFTDDVWHCFHCEQKGNIFHLVMAKNNCDFFEAKKLLADKVGIKLKKKLTVNGLEIDDYTDNVETFHHQQPFFYDRAGLFWFWNFEEHKYELRDETDVMIALDDVLCFEGKTVNTKLKIQYLEAFKRVGRKHTPKEAPAKWIQFKNKAYSLESGNIYDVTSDFFFTNPIPFEMSVDDQTPVMDKLFTEWVGAEYVDDLYEIIAYCCYRNYPIQLLFCLAGSGRNGKSCYIRLLNKFIGQQNISSTELDTLVNSRFETVKLYKKLVCTMGETNFGILAKTSLLKKLVGGDLIGYEFKNKTPFDDVNYAKIIISSNSLPSTDDTSDGFFRRWHIIKFPNEFQEGKDILLTIPDVEYNNLARKVVKILPKLIEAGKFSNQGSIDQRKENYMQVSNPLPLFLKKFCEKSDDKYTLYNELYTAYVKYLLDNKKRKVKMKEFKGALEDEGFWVDKTNKLVGHNEDGYPIYKSAYWIEGIGLKDNWKTLLCDKNDNCDNVSTQYLHVRNGVKSVSQLSQLSQKPKEEFVE